MKHFKEFIQEEIHAPGTKVVFPHKGKMTSGKVVRYDKGDKHGTPFYVVDHGEYRSATPPAHKVEKYAFQEAVEPKFQRATKTEVHYTGMINNKTYVVPHSFHGNHDVLHGTKTTQIRHAIVTSPHHIQHNNPDLSPEEVTRIHSHIKDIHGVQAASKYDSFGKLEETHTIKGTAQTYDGKTSKWSTDERTYTVRGNNRKRSLTLALKRLQKDFPHHKEHEVTLQEEYEYPDPSPVKKLFTKIEGAATRKELKAARPMKLGAAERFMRRYGKTQIKEERYFFDLGGNKGWGYVHAPSRDEAIKKVTKNHNQAPIHIERAKENFLKLRESHISHDGSYKAGTKVTVDGKHGEISHVHHSPEHPKYPHSYKITDTAANDPYKQTRLRGNTFISHNDVKPHLEEGSPNKFFKHHDVARHHQTKIAKQTLRMPDAMVGVMGGPNKDEARKHLKNVGWTDKMIHHHEHGPGDTTMHHLDEQSTGKEEIVNDIRADLKKKLQSFRERHAKVQLKATKGKSGEGYLEEAATFMTTYRRNESQNRHTANIVHLAKHFGDEADKAQAKFYADELKKHGHQPHHEKTFELHQKLYPKAVKAHMEIHPSGKVRLHKEEFMNEELHAYDVHHKGKHIDTIFYGHHEEPESVKKSLVNHDGYHPDITVKKQPKHPGQKVTSARWDAANKKLEEVNVPTLHSYIKKAASDILPKGHEAKEFNRKAGVARTELGRKTYDDASSTAYNKQQNRIIGIKRAADRLVFKEGEKLTEATGMTFKDAINVAKKGGYKITYGTASKHWHTIDAKDRDYNTSFALDPHTAERHGEATARRVSTSPRHLEESSTFKTVKGIVAEAHTREHFRQVAEVIKRISDAKERQEIADHNAALFAKKNPRFDHAKFHAAAGTVHKKD